METTGDRRPRDGDQLSEHGSLSGEVVDEMASIAIPGNYRRMISAWQMAGRVDKIHGIPGWMTKVASTGKSVREEAPVATFAIIELPSLEVEIVEVKG